MQQDSDDDSDADEASVPLPPLSSLPVKSDARASAPPPPRPYSEAASSSSAAPVRTVDKSRDGVEAAFSGMVLERAPGHGSAPSDSDILMREIHREKARHDERRAAAARAAQDLSGGSGGMAMGAAVEGQDLQDGGEQPKRVSRFMASRRP